MLCEQARVAAQPFALLAIWLSLSVACISAERVTAGVDYGFGPLWIDYDSVGDTLSRCDNVSMKLGGGFGPYYLSSWTSCCDLHLTQLTEFVHSFGERRQ